VGTVRANYCGSSYDHCPNDWQQFLQKISENTAILSLPFKHEITKTLQTTTQLDAGAAASSMQPASKPTLSQQSSRAYDAAHNSPALFASRKFKFSLVPPLAACLSTRSRPLRPDRVKAIRLLTAHGFECGRFQWGGSHANLKFRTSTPICHHSVNVAS